MDGTAGGGDEAGTVFVESLTGKRVMVRDELGYLLWGTLARVERAADVEEVVRITVALEDPPALLRGRVQNHASAPHAAAGKPRRRYSRELRLTALETKTLVAVLMGVLLGPLSVFLVQRRVRLLEEHR